MTSPRFFSSLKKKKVKARAYNTCELQIVEKSVAFALQQMT